MKNATLVEQRGRIDRVIHAIRKYLTEPGRPTFDGKVESRDRLTISYMRMFGVMALSGLSGISTSAVEEFIRRLCFLDWKSSFHTNYRPIPHLGSVAGYPTVLAWRAIPPRHSVQW
jgi:hypothetical protein